jgi:hypothetical protein
MRWLGFVLLPFLLQLAFVLVIIALTNGKGSFVGLAAMALGLWLLPITALINWWGCRRAGAQSWGRQVLRTAAITALFPILLVALYALAS